MTVRLSDVAARAGVSVKTVSNVVNGYVHVRPETRARVQAALDELGYRPNLSARTLRRGRSGLVALAVPSLEAPYFAELAAAVVEASSDRGWTVLVDQTDGLAEREREVAAGLRGHLIDGLLLSPVALGAGELLPFAARTPLVLLGERISGGQLDHVAVDNVAASRAATEHLLGLGRRRVAAIGAQREPAASSGVAQLRQRGFEEGLAAAGVDLPAAWLPVVSSYTRAEGVRAMAQLLDTTPVPDAVFCFNDLLALGAMRLLAQRGLRVPDDVAVIGFDDIEEGRYATPSLSTVAPDKVALARTSVDILAARLDGSAAAAPVDVSVPFALAARESTLGAVP